MTAEIGLDMIRWIITFLSGACGVYIGLRVGIARLEVNYCHMRTKLEEAEDDIDRIRDNQIGILRCDKYRSDCQKQIDKKLDHMCMELTRLADSLKQMEIYVAKHHVGD